MDGKRFRLVPDNVVLISTGVYGVCARKAGATLPPSVRSLKQQVNGVCCHKIDSRLQTVELLE